MLGEGGGLPLNIFFGLIFFRVGLRYFFTGGLRNFWEIEKFSGGGGVEKFSGGGGWKLSGGGGLRNFRGGGGVEKFSGGG